MTLKVRSLCVGFEELFYSHGVRVARYPKLWMAISFAITALSALGFLRFSWEKNYIELYVPINSVSFGHAKHQKAVTVSDQISHSFIKLR